MDPVEQQRLIAEQAQLPLAQQEQIKLHVTGYRQQLLTSTPAIEHATLNSLVYQFWKTLITQLAKRNAEKPKPLSIAAALNIGPGDTGPSQRPIAPPKSDRPLIEVTFGDRKYFVQPTFRDWRLRVHASLPHSDAAVHVAADRFCEMEIGRMQRVSAQYEWLSHSVPTADQLRALLPEQPKANKAAPVKAARRAAPVESADFIAFPNATLRPARAAGAAGKTRHALDAEERRKREERLNKYGGVTSENPVYRSIGNTPEKAEVDVAFGDDADEVFLKTHQFSIQGTCMEVEKAYYRLTSAPDASSVRPVEVLRRQLSNLVRHYLQNGKESYNYMSSQLKAIRQDLTVQAKTKTEFAAVVYEYHARLALENGDLGQFNQCQTQLKELHIDTTLFVPADSKAEFLAYALIYFTLQDLKVDQYKFLANLPENFQAHAFVVFSVQIRNAVIAGNFAQYFALTRAAETTPVPSHIPSHAKYLLGAFAEPQRVSALAKLCKTCLTVGVDWTTEMLGFSSTEECAEYFRSLACVFKDAKSLDAKSTLLAIANHPALVGRKSAVMG